MFDYTVTERITHRNYLIFDVVLGLFQVVLVHLERIIDGGQTDTPQRVCGSIFINDLVDAFTDGVCQRKSLFGGGGNTNEVAAFKDRLWGALLRVSHARIKSTYLDKQSGLLRRFLSTLSWSCGARGSVLGADDRHGLAITRKLHGGNLKGGDFMFGAW